MALNRLVGEPNNTALPRGFGPGKFLIVSTSSIPELSALESEDHHWGDVFEGYLSLWIRLAWQLCPDAV